jgi:hypothetical protein
MLDWQDLSRRSILTVFWLCLVGLCVVPFLLGSAFCDEFNAAPLDQSALVDEDNVDPSKATVDSFSSNHQLSTHILLSRTSDDRETIPTADPLSPPHCCTVVSLTSRPPPIS